MHQDNKIFLKSQGITQPATLLFETIFQQQSFYLFYSKLGFLVEVHGLIKKSQLSKLIYICIFVKTNTYISSRNLLFNKNKHYLSEVDANDSIS